MAVSVDKRQRKMWRNHPRHAFTFTVKLNNGKVTKVRSLARVILAKHPVDLELIEPDVQKSIKAGGRGNMATCAMAQCADRLAKQFPHKYVGYIDWLLKTTFVASKLDPKTGLPSECYKYEHRDEVAHLFDSKGGEEKLIEQIKLHGGSLTIGLKPARHRIGESRKGGHTPATGKRSTPISGGHARRTIKFALGEGLMLQRP